MRVIYQRVWEELDDFLLAGGGPFHLVSPFITVPVLESLIRRHPVQAVYTSWRPDLLLTGHSSLDLYPLLRSSGINLITCDRLHAKVVVNSEFSRALIGSANLTRRGLGLVQDSNIEAAILVEGDSGDLRSFISSIMVSGLLVDDAIYQAYCAWLEENADKRSVPNAVLGPSIPSPVHGPWMLALLPASPSPRALWEAVNLDRSESAATAHDVVLFGGGLTGSKREVNERLRNALSRNPFFQYILESIRRAESGIHFGGMKELVQSRCANVPTPHRRDLTEIIQNQYQWIVELYPDTFEVVRPKWSEVIRVRR